MQIIRTLIIGAASLGLAVFATPAQAHDDNDRNFHRHHHHHHGDKGTRVYINQGSPVYGTSTDTNVTIAYGGHRDYRHHHHHHWHGDRD